MPHGFSRHDHTACISTALARAEAACDASGAQFTPARRRTLEILLEEHRALGAYEVLDRLRVEGLGSQPPVAYRALDFLVKQGLAHRIERLNAFVACTHGTGDHVPAFFICDTCEAVAESVLDPTLGALASNAQEANFSISQVVVEARGTCGTCQSTQA